MAPLGLLVAGPIVDHLGVHIWYLVAGLVCLLIGATGFFMRPVLAIEQKRVPMVSQRAPLAINSNEGR
jgi:hypothetical protein